MQPSVIRLQVRDDGADEGRWNLCAQLTMDDCRGDGTAVAGESEAGYCIQETEILQH